MPSEDRYFDEIDSNRLRRAKELMELKDMFAGSEKQTRFGVQSKAVIVLSYAHWEGFYNECVASYLSHLKSKNLVVSDFQWSMLLGLIRSRLKSVYDKNNSLESGVKFVSELKILLNSDFSEFDESIVAARSNLDWKKLSVNFGILGFDLSDLQEFRLRIDKELVGWRHSIAHGDDPKLVSVDLDGHVDFTQKLLLHLSDTFQASILKG